MKYEIIGSSSKGNAIIIEDILLLDAGVSYVKLKKHLNKVKLIFISHVHKDHLLPSTIKKISHYYPNIKYLTGSIEVINKLYQNGVNQKDMIYISSEKWYDIGALKIKLQKVVHDTDNYCLHFEYKGKKGIYIVDTASVDNIEAKDYDLYLIEANYKEELLEYHKENCENDNELFYLNRVPFTHLSYEKSNEFLINNMGNNSEYQYIHQSSYNYKEE